MPSLWTDDDRGTHPWIATRSRDTIIASDAAANTTPEAGGARRFARPAVLAAACAAAAIAGALIEVLR